MNIDTVLKKEELLDSKSFLKVISSKKTDNIKSITFIPPRVGIDRNFGQFKVVYKTPFYCMDR
ncbi:MAG: hypothetical protein U0O25_08205 [Succinivibrio sp.]|uniref:hypothetical protein n=1 Tax=Succinivibrio sp. TaxID=2053619 RepID=UPI002F92D966